MHFLFNLCQVFPAKEVFLYLSHLDLPVLHQKAYLPGLSLIHLPVDRPGGDLILEYFPEPWLIP